MRKFLRSSSIVILGLVLAWAGTPCVSAGDHSAIVFVGGWGASSYQYAFSGTCRSAAYRPMRLVTREVNRVIGEFVAED